MESGPKTALKKRLDLQLAGLRVAQGVALLPAGADEADQVEAEVEEGDDGAEVVQGAGGLGPAEDGEHRLGPVGVVELERHAGDHQQQEAGHHQDVQEALEGREAGEALVVVVTRQLGLAEGLGVVR